nr:MAG TPA: Integrin beta-2 [Caudoviricetes sp.]
MDREELRLEIERIQQMQQTILESEKSIDKTEKVLILVCMAIGGLVLTLIISIICYLVFFP